MRGVYIIKNVLTGYSYVGSSNNISMRIDNHFELLENGIHYNYKIQNAYKKHKKFFVHGIVKEFEYFHTREEIYKFEQEVLDSVSDRYNILLNTEDHLLEDRSKRERVRQLKINYGRF